MRSSSPPAGLSFPRIRRVMSRSCLNCKAIPDFRLAEKKEKEKGNREMKQRDLLLLDDEEGRGGESCSCCKNALLNYAKTEEKGKKSASEGRKNISE